MKIIILGGLLLLLSCMPSKSEPEYITLLDKTTAKFCKDVFLEHQLVCRGYGGKLMDDIASVNQYFFSAKRSDVPAARRLIVSCIEKLTAMINADQKLQPFLHQFPFPAERVALNVAFADKEGHDYADGSVAYVTAFDGKIFYAKRNPKTDRLEDLHQEDYAEALRIVNSETQPGKT